MMLSGNCCVHGEKECDDDGWDGPALFKRVDDFMGEPPEEDDLWDGPSLNKKEDW